MDVNERLAELIREGVRIGFSESQLQSMATAARSLERRNSELTAERDALLLALDRAKLGNECVARERDKLTARIAELEAALEKAYIRESQALESYEDSELTAIKLRAALAEARKDSARLDWLELQASVPAVTLVKADGLRERNRFTAVTETGRVGDFATVRHAIDAGMRPVSS